MALRAGATAALCLAAALFGPVPAEARSLTLGFGDPAFSGTGPERALDLGVDANAQIVRIHAGWSAIAPSRPLNPEDPADPAYRFGAVDAAVRAAAARGFDILLEAGNAPGWAEGPGRPPISQARAGTWRPDASAYGQFATALANRYSGGFAPAAGQAPLPRIARYQAWNEPSLSFYLTPQGSADRPESARIYRDLLTSFYRGVKKVDPGATVASAGTAPFGGKSSSGSARSHPVSFVRELLCLNGGSLAAAGCDEPVPLDVLAHHPINNRSPFEGAEDPQDVTTPDLSRLRALLRQAERKNRVSPSGSRPIWVTEFWWESNPPDRTYGVPERVQARYMAEALYLFWKQRVALVLGLQLADSPIDPANPGDSFQTGVYFEDARPKDSLTAFRFPVVGVRGRRKLQIWGRAPAAGRLAIQLRKDHRWRTIERLRVDEGEVFRDRHRVGGRPKVRARVAGENSLTYKSRKN